MSIKFLCIVLMMGSLLQGENYMFRGSEEQRNMATEAQALVNADTQLKNRKPEPRRVCTAIGCAYTYLN